MPKPTMGSVHTVEALRQMAIGYRHPLGVLGGAFPEIAVDKETDVYKVWNKDDFFRDEAKAVRPGDEAPRGGFKVDSDVTYTAKCWKFAWEIPDRLRRQMDPAIAADVNAVRRCMDKIALKKEREIASTIQAASWTTTDPIAGGSEWLQGTTYGGTPVQTIDANAEAVQALIGHEVNTMIISRKIARILRRHPHVLDLVKYVGSAPAKVTMAHLSEIFEIPRILVVRMIYNSSNEGDSTPTYTNVWGDYCWLGYVAPRPAFDEPSAGYTFKVGTPGVKSWREDSRDQDVYEAQETFVAKATALDAGALISNTWAA